jgi:integrase/recombinase XerD
MTKTNAVLTDFGPTDEQTDRNDETSEASESSAIIDEVSEAEESSSLVDKYANDQDSDEIGSEEIDPDQYDLDHPLARNWIAKRDAERDTKRGNQGWSDSTIATYQSNVRIYLSFLDERETDLISADYQDLVQFLRFREAVGVAQKTADNDCNALKNLYAYIHACENADPVLDSNHFEEINLTQFDWVGGFERTSLSYDEVQLLFENHKRPRNRLMTYLAVGTGLRNSDVRELRLQDVDYENLEIHVPDPKNSDPYDIAMSRELASQLKRWEEIGREGYPTAQSSEFMFPSRQGEKLEYNATFNQFVVRAAERAELQWPLATRVMLNSEDLRDIREQTVYGVTVHTLRHTYITLLQEAGVPPEARRLAANHDSIEVTKEHYSHGEPEWLGMVRDLCPF